MSEPVGVVKQIESKISASVDKVEAAAAPLSTPPEYVSVVNGEVTLLDRLLNFVYECWRMFWPMVAIAVILWYYESIRLSYFKAQALEPAWVRTLNKVQQGLIGLLIAHITWSGTFRYVKTRRLMKEDVATFRSVLQSRVIWYAAWIVGMYLGMG